MRKALRNIIVIALSFGWLQSAKAQFSDKLLRPTREQFELSNQKLEIMKVKPIAKGQIKYNPEKMDCIGAKPQYKGSGEIKFTGLALKQHLAHYAAIPPKKGYFAFALDLTVNYDVLKPWPVYLESNNEACYWHLFNYETGSRGALYSKEHMQIDKKGLQAINVHLYRGYEPIRKGTNLIAGHHFYAIYDLFTDRYLGLCKGKGGIRQGWGIQDPVIRNNKYYPDLLFTLANLTKFKLNFENFKCAWKPGTPFRISLTVTDADGEKFFLPRANMKAVLRQGRKKKTIPLTPVFYDQAMPKGYFTGKIPDDILPQEITISAEVIYAGTDGKTKDRKISVQYTKNQNLTEPNHITKDLPPALDRNSEGTIRETRLLFTYYSQCLTKKDIDEVMEKMVAANFNVLMCNFQDKGTVLWKSKLVPRLSIPGHKVEKGLDPLAYTIEVAHRHGIEVHLSFSSFMPPYEWSKEWKVKAEQLRKKFRIFPSGVPYDHQRVCSLDKNYRRHFVSLLEEVCKNYDIDGINLDLIRWKKGCFCEHCISDYKKKTGRNLRYDYDNYCPYLKVFTDWHEEIITETVRAVHDGVKKIKPGIKMSNCAYALSSPDCRNRTIQGQVTHLWLNEGLLDFSVIMAYSTNSWRSIILHTDYLRAVDVPSRVGLLLDLIDRGVGLFHEHPELVVSQVKAARRQGFKIVGFYWSGWLHDDIVEALREGPFKDKAIPYWDNEEVAK
jgi:uncharacterized lipoprotein YddW (UPF0748 family)